MDSVSKSSPSIPTERIECSPHLQTAGSGLKFGIPHKHLRAHTMKLEDILMQRSRERQRRLDLEQEVAELQEVLESEQSLSRVLRCAMHGPLVCRSCMSSFLPLQARVLLAEIDMVEEEIIFLERKVKDLKLNLYLEREQQNEWGLHQRRQHRHMKFLYGLRGQIDVTESLQSFHPETRSSQSHEDEIHAPLELVAETNGTPCTSTDSHSCHESDLGWRIPPDEEASKDTPNRLSEELIDVLISIFHRLHKASAHPDCEQDAVPKLNISCMSSRSLVSRSLNTAKMLDPYGVLLEGERATRDIGAYKRFVHFTRNSLDMSRITLCAPAIGRLRILMHELCTVELSFLTYKQRLAFWINIYNACIMHAILRHGLPPSPDKLLELLNKAAVNVGGIVLNALAIEHFILRPSSGTKNGAVEEKERLLRHAYGLGYPEPNVTFALCRGSWSSPALRVYTAENVMNELERAKVEYLEASIGITSKKKIVIPKLLHWHMQDFADDIESLLEWTYSQLPRTGSLKRSVMECLSGDAKVPLAKMVEIQPYEDEFRYMFPF